MSDARTVSLALIDLLKHHSQKVLASQAIVGLRNDYKLTLPKNPQKFLHSEVLPLIPGGRWHVKSGTNEAWIMRSSDLPPATSTSTTSKPKAKVKKTPAPVVKAATKPAPAPPKAATPSTHEKQSAVKQKTPVEPEAETVSASARAFHEYAEENTGESYGHTADALIDGIQDLLIDGMSDQEFSMIGGLHDDSDGEDVLNPIDTIHKLRYCPMFTRDVLEAVRVDSSIETSLFPQYSLFGKLALDNEHIQFEDRRLYISMDSPLSTIVCGVMGSGKSHTVSTLLEACLLRDRRIGRLPAPLAGLVCHFDNISAGSAAPCEAAYLAASKYAADGKAASGVNNVTVLVSPSNYSTMKKVYSKLPQVHVRPLFFSTADLNIQRMMTLMAVDHTEQLPLYLQVVEMLLRDMGDQFSYAQFRQQLERQEFTPMQRGPLNMRLALLDSFLGEQVAKKVVGANYAEDDIEASKSAMMSLKPLFRPGSLVICDLTDPFIDGGAACALFDILLGLFMETKIETGRMVVLDEAHKYLNKTYSSEKLTGHLLSIIRQQRHLATRVIISTQEPTVLPEALIDLSPIVIAHRFSSPSWWQHLKKHVVSDEHDSDEIFEKIVRLSPGEAIVFSSSSMYYDPQLIGSASKYQIFGNGPVKVRVRQRLTRDGGKSVLAVSENIGKLVAASKTMHSKIAAYSL